MMRQVGTREVEDKVWLHSSKYYDLGYFDFPSIKNTGTFILNTALNFAQAKFGAANWRSFELRF